MAHWPKNPWDSTLPLHLTTELLLPAHSQGQWTRLPLESRVNSQPPRLCQAHCFSSQQHPVPLPLPVNFLRVSLGSLFPRDFPCLGLGLAVVSALSWWFIYCGLLRISLLNLTPLSVEWTDRSDPESSSSLGWVLWCPSDTLRGFCLLLSRDRIRIST